MKFSSFKEFRGQLSALSAQTESADGKLKRISEYLRVDITKVLRELAVGLTRLSLLDNFDSFSVQVTIPATTEVEIRNELVSKEVPTQRLIVRGGSGAENIVDGDTQWTKDFVYLQNTGGSDVTVTVMFLK